VEKIPAEKLQPYLAKKRAEADRRLSEADKKLKDASARIESVSRWEEHARAIQSDPERLWDLAKALNITPEKLHQMSVKQVTEKIEAGLAEEELQRDPVKKLEKDRAEFEKQKAEAEQKEEVQYRAHVRQEVDNYIISGLESIPGDRNNPAVLSLKQDVAEVMTFLVEELVDKEKQIPPGPELAKQALNLIQKRPQAARSQFSPEELKSAEKILRERWKAAQAKKVQHPAANPKGQTSRPAVKRSDPGAEPMATSTLLKLLKF
jgi:hypothetical protein